MVIRHKEGHYIILKGSIHQEDNIIINIYSPNISASKYMRWTLAELKEEIDLQ